MKVNDPQGDRPVINFFLLYILEKNDIKKTCRPCFEIFFLFVKIFFCSEYQIGADLVFRDNW